MPKSLGSFLEDCRREIPNEVVHVTKQVDPAHYDVSALIKHLDELRKFPILVFDNPLNLHGQPSDIKLTMNCEISQGKTQVALGLDRNTSREAMTDICLEREATAFLVTHSIPEAVILSDRIYVMQANPGRIAEAVEIDLPRPRTLDMINTARFGEIVGYIREKLDSEGFL